MPVGGLGTFRTQEQWTAKRRAKPITEGAKQVTLQRGDTGYMEHRGAGSSALCRRRPTCAGLLTLALALALPLPLALALALTCAPHPSNPTPSSTPSSINPSKHDSTPSPLPDPQPAQHSNSTRRLFVSFSGRSQ